MPHRRSMYLQKIKVHGFEALIIGAVLVSWATLSVAGASPDYSARIWQMEDGLPHNIVQAIEQTGDGYLWVGTREGLARFDGVEFRGVELTTQTKHASVLCLKATRDGVLWAGTDSLGLFRLDKLGIRHISGPDGSTNYTVHELHESNGELWMASSLGVFRHTAGRLERHAEFRGSVESMCVDGSGNVWHAVSGELRRLYPQPGTNYTPHVGRLPPDARKLYWHPDGTFFLASGSGIIGLKDGVITTYPKAKGPAGFVDAFLTDTHRQLWVGAYAGLSRFLNGRFLDENGPEGPSYRVFSIFEDAEKSLWVGSEEGLTRLTPKTFRTYTRSDGLTLNSIVTVCASRDGSTWVGVWGGGLNRISGERITALGKGDGLSSEFVMAMCEGKDGSLWVGADYGNPLNRIKDGKVTWFGQEQGLTPGAHTALVEDRESRLWIGSRNGLQVLHDGLVRRYGPRDGLSHEKINALCLSHDGAVWIGTAGGLTRAQQENLEDYSQRNPALKTAILCLYENSEKTLWIGTDGAGLLRLQGTNVSVFSYQIGLLSDSLYSVQEDNSGNLWLGSSRGIFRVSIQDLEEVAAGQKLSVTSIGYGKSDGILSSGQYREVTQPAACRSLDGRLWFRTTQGAVTVNPAHINVNRRPPPVVIEQVVGDRQTVWKRLGSDPSGALEIPRGRGELEILYTALSLRAPERNRFRYRLSGVDPDWVEAGTRRSAYYNKVLPGEYRFQVTACNNDGLWNREGTVLYLNVLPHFWQTRTFWLFSIGVCVAGIVSLAAWVTRLRMRRELRRLEQQHAIERERARIARDMHDELGAKLARISFQGATARRVLDNPEQAGPQVEKMAETARELVTSLDEMVWAVDPANDSLEHIIGYICRYAGQFFDESAIQCEFVIPDALPACKLSSDVRHHLFMACKEALTNVMRHARASRVKVELSLSKGCLEIQITDNGIGLLASEAPDNPNNRRQRSGHGLTNIRERLKTVGGRAEITSGGQGTIVLLIVPLENSACHPFI